MTFQSFNLTLDGGNAEMETRHHIGDALRAMALKMYHHANQSSPPLSGYIRDTQWQHHRRVDHNTRGKGGNA